MPKVINENKLKQEFILLNKQLKNQKFKQYVFTGVKIIEEDFCFDVLQIKNKKTKSKFKNFKT